MIRFLAASILATLFHLGLFLLPPCTERKPPLLTGQRQISVTLSTPQLKNEEYKEKPEKDSQKSAKTQDYSMSKNTKRRDEKKKHLTKELPPSKLKRITPKKRKKHLTPSNVHNESETKEQDKPPVSEGENILPEPPQSISGERKKENSQKVQSSTSPSLIEAVPRYHDNPKPVYPLMARRRGWQGEVVLAVMVRKNGSVEQAKIKKSCSYKLLDESALKSVMRWRFTPGYLNGEPKKMEVLVPIHFQLY